MIPTKDKIAKTYPEIENHPIMRGFFSTTLSIPEIQAQIKRLLIYRSTNEHCGDEEAKHLFERFLEVTQAPEDIHQRYRGEQFLRIYLPYTILDTITNYPPEHLRGGGYCIQGETDETCLASKMNPQIIDWLRLQGIRVQWTWKSEIGRLPTKDEEDSR